MSQALLALLSARTALGDDLIEALKLGIDDDVRCRGVLSLNWPTDNPAKLSCQGNGFSLCS